MRTEAGCCENLFSQSPWLTTFSSSRPLMILLLLLSLGPCLIKRLMAFVQQQVTSVWLRLLRSQYHPLEPLARQNSPGLSKDSPLTAIYHHSVYLGKHPSDLE